MTEPHKLIEALEDPESRETAAAKLLHFGESALPALMKSLDRPNWHVRVAVINILAAMGDKRAIVSLREKLDDKMAPVEKAAAAALVRLGGEALLEAELRNVCHKRRRRVALILDSMGWAPRNESELALLHIARQNWEELNMQSESTVTALVEALSDPNDEIRSKASDLLITTGSDAVDPVCDGLRKSVGRNKEFYIHVLVGIGDERCVRSIKELLHDNLDSVRKEAVAAVGNIIGLRAESLLETALEDRSFNVRKAALDTLVSLGWRPSDDRQKTLYAIAERKWESLVSLGPSAVGPLISAIRIREISANAARVLASIKGPALEALIESLFCDSSQAKVWAAWSLGEIGDKTAVDPLKETLRDEDRWLRIMSALALGKLGDNAAVPALTILMNQDQDRCVRAASEWALWKLAGESGDEPPLQVIMDVSPIGGAAIAVDIRQPPR
jgi:HEAT repeat protein